MPAAKKYLPLRAHVLAPRNPTKHKGMLEAVDRDAVRKGAKGKGFWE
jgi:hypothetical protein